MEKNYHSRGSSKRFDIDKKMIGILSVFTCLGILLVFTIVTATTTMSALRGFASLQTHWTETRKEASIQLTSYLRTGEEQYYQGFNESVDLIQDIKVIREELLKESPDYNKVRKSFLKIPAIPEDSDALITTFERYHRFPDFQQAINQWIVSDSFIDQMQALISNLRQEKDTNSFDTVTREEAIAHVFELDRKLTEAQHKLTGALSSGTYFLKQLILWVSSSLGLILLITGGFLSFRFLKSLKQSRIAIEVSEQRYRSLFEQNPNAVCSISKEGRFLQGNKALESMLGYPLKDLKGEEFSRFVEPSDLEKVKKHFQKALEGDPQFFEAVGIKKNGDRIYTEITSLPIYVDGEITGVYGITQNITERKNNEQKIKEQLEEKSHLLIEIHDRVKNNMTLILSLIQLQRDEIINKELKSYFDRTIARIFSMAMVHEQLYDSTNFSKIRMDKYLHQFRDSLENDAPADQLIIDTDPITLGVKQAIPMALLLNELITNVFKCGAEKHSNGAVKISLSRQQDQIVLTIAEKSGLHRKNELEESESLEFKLIQVLIQQLEGSFELNQESGISIKIHFTQEHQKLRTA